eukprot:gnl/MRDRNA2_/MRDRNA2_86417_c0_seq11.p1 gnl/MRDRNA2_/MRDRNA2_86417_c0~~gnl/MRDRNA2_/MRDRNA2_86417_c0_seq11.p1  ORF type:complete len:153 (+),score=22.58 gnl/MRDRNA2_/MRDRNA2_86417_c0_seq11:97-555(+)
MMQVWHAVCAIGVAGAGFMLQTFIRTGFAERSCSNLPNFMMTAMEPGPTPSQERNHGTGTLAQSLLDESKQTDEFKDVLVGRPQADVLSEMTLAVQPGLHDILLEKEDLEERDDRSLLNGGSRSLLKGDNGCTGTNEPSPCSTDNDCPGKKL